MRELEADLGIPKTTSFENLTQNLGMKNVMVKFIPRFLLPEQKEHHVALANDLIQASTNEPDLAFYDFWLFSKLKLSLKGKRFQTVDEIWENMTGQLMVIPRKDFFLTFLYCCSSTVVSVFPLPLPAPHPSHSTSHP